MTLTLSKNAEAVMKRVRERDPFGSGTADEVAARLAQHNNFIVPFGIPTLDAISGGGIHPGRIHLFWGRKHGGKTTAAINVIREAQKLGVQCVFIDTEGSNADDVGKAYIRSLGVDTAKLIMCQPTSLEEAGQALQDFCSVPDFGLIVYDSLAAGTAEKVFEKEFGESVPFIRATRNADLASRVSTLIARNRNRFIGITHETNPTDQYSRPEAQGGKKFPFLASLELQFSTAGSPNTAGGKKDAPAVSQDVTVTNKKSKVGAAYGKTQLVLNVGSGFDIELDTLRFATQLGIIERAAAWLRYKEEKWNGEQAALGALQNDPALLDAIRHDITAKLAA